MPRELKILVLEDNPADAALIERELRFKDTRFFFQRAATKKEFVNALADFAPDLILADYKLPAYTGLEALRDVQDASFNIPLIIVTGSINEDTAVHCLKEGAADYVTKEHLMRLPSAVTNALEKKKITDERSQMVEALKQQNKFLNNILEAITHPFFVIDAQTREVKMANAAGHQWQIEKGVLCGEADPGGPPSDRRSLNDPLEQVKSTKQASVTEQTFRFKDGIIRHYSLHSYPILGEDGSVKQVITYLLDITDRKLTEERIKNSLQEKETLLKEIFHRVKNNLQVISSLLSLQGQYFKEHDEIYGIFKKSRDRIQAMALIHEKLYQSQDMTRVDFVKYIRDLVNQLFSSYGVLPDAVTLKISMNDVHMDINAAIPCGLIINELISNALKHAFPAGRKGKISVALFTYENRAFNLIVSDDGVGFPQAVSFPESKSLGLQLVKTLVQQMGGEIMHDRSGGTTFKIVFIPPKRKYTDHFVLSN